MDEITTLRGEDAGWKMVIASLPDWRMATQMTRSMYAAFEICPSCCHPTISAIIVPCYTPIAPDDALQWTQRNKPFDSRAFPFKVTSGDFDTTAPAVGLTSLFRSVVGGTRYDH